MTLITRITVKCDGKRCPRFLRTATNDSLKAEEIARKKGWVEHDWDTYGNRSHFCCQECLVACLKAFVLVLMIGTSLAAAEPSVLRISQSGKRTSGCVIQSTTNGTWILTCKHGRRASDPWFAGPLSGSYTRCADKDDLALLWTRERWQGPVLKLAETEPKLPLVFAGRGPLPWGSPFYWTKHPVRAGDSGLPLVVGGKLCGVLAGIGSEGDALFTTREDIRRFLEAVR